MNRKLLLLGGGGHCRSVLDSVLAADRYKEIGIIDKDKQVGDTVLGILIIGSDDDLVPLFQQGYTDAFISIGSIGSPAVRIRLFEKLEKAGFNIPNIIDPTAVVGRDVQMKNGIYIGKNAVVNVGSQIGKGSIINTSVIIEHDCVIGDFVHAAPGCVLCGEVRIGSNTHIGANSVVKQQVVIGSGTMVGMGSVVLHDLPDNTLAYGNPCREAVSK